MVLKKIFLTFIAVLLVNAYSYAQSDPIVGTWFNEEKTAKVRIYEATNGKFYGKIVWLETPAMNGKPRVDENNPDKDKRNNRLDGLVILKGFEKDDDEYDDGTIYDPKNGKTYSCIITHKGDKLDVRGYVGFSWIGRTTEWTKAD